MDDQTLPPATDPFTVKMQRELYYQVVHDLIARMPAPDHESVDEHIRRFYIATAQVAALQPVNADEVHIAARYVAAGVHADECMRLATYHAANPVLSAQLYRQANSLTRESRGLRSLLLRVQTDRRKRSGNEKAQQQDAWTEHAVLESMTKALEHLAPAPRRAPPPPPPPPQTPPRPAAPPQRAAAARPAAPARPAVPLQPTAAQQRNSDAQMLRWLEGMTDKNGDLSDEAIMRQAGALFDEPPLLPPDPVGKG